MSKMSREKGKRFERMNLYDWMAQSVSDTEAEGKGRIPVEIHKANNKPVLATMKLEDWFILSKAYVALQDRSCDYEG